LGQPESIAPAIFHKEFSVLRTRLSILRTVGLASLLAVLPALTSTAVASNANKQYNRGCADAKAGSYDRAHHNADYEKGWQACKNQAQAAASGNKDYDRGCADAKVGSYDRAHHNAEYEKGWQACKTQPQAAAAKAAPSKQEQACLAAVSNKANNGEVTVLSSEFSQANSVVMIGVGSQRAPWRCLVSNSGVVQEVMFAGSEGGL